MELSCFIFLLKIRVKLWSYRKCEKMTCGGNTAESKYLEQSKEIQLNWTRVENFDIYFCIHFNCLPKYNFCIGNWAPGYVSTKSWNFSNVFYFAKIVSLKLFGSSWGNSYAEFVIPYIKSCFTSGESDL